MKIHYISDLHLDFYIKEMNKCKKLESEISKFIKRLNIFDIDENEREVIILAGDIGHYFEQNSVFLIKLKELFKYVIIVPGNHDYYLVTSKQMKKYTNNSLNRIMELKNFCENNDIIFLNGEIVNICGINIFGSMGFWDNSYMKFMNYNLDGTQIEELYKTTMNDVNKIMFDKIPYKIQMSYGSYYIKNTFNVNEFRESEFKKFNKIIEYSSHKNQNVDLIITHYCPSLHIDYGNYAGHKYNTFYIFDNTEIQKLIKPKFWIFGHIHHKQDFVHNNTRYLCNPFGYPSEKTERILKNIIIQE